MIDLHLNDLWIRGNHDRSESSEAISFDIQVHAEKIYVLPVPRTFFYHECHEIPNVNFDFPALVSMIVKLHIMHLVNEA